MVPKFKIIDSKQAVWEKDSLVKGVEIKRLCSANNQRMEMFRFAPNITYPDHVHIGPEFVYLLEGTARVDGKWIEPGWASVGETGTWDKEFKSGESGCIFISVFTEGSKYDK